VAIIVKVNVDPCLTVGSETKDILPSRLFTIFLLTHKPIPIPSLFMFSVSLKRWKGLKTFFLFWSVMPTPVSEIEHMRSDLLLSNLTLISIDPLCVYFSAFETKLRTICWSRDWSVKIVSGTDKSNFILNDIRLASAYSRKMCKTVLSAGTN